MNELTDYEKELLNRISKPRIEFNEIEIKLNEIAVKHGFENYRDFLNKTGWHERFFNDMDDVKARRFKSYKSMSIGYRDNDE